MNGRNKRNPFRFLPGQKCNKTGRYLFCFKQTLRAAIMPLIAARLC